jgi:hypothetical protein
MDMDDLNMPEEIMAELASNERKRPPGYPQQLNDDRLWNSRQHLRFLLESTWDEVGCVLPRVRTMAQMREALKPWEKRIEREEHTVRALLRNTEFPATSRLLYRQRKQQEKLHERFLSAHDWIGKCWESPRAIHGHSSCGIIASRARRDL